MSLYEFTRCPARQEPTGNAQCYCLIGLVVVSFAVGLLMMAVS